MRNFKIKNFSRHELNRDQALLITKAFNGEKAIALGEPLAPFFKDAKDLFEQINNQTAVVVVPFDLMLEAMSLGLTTTVLVFPADQQARKAGYFATKSLKVMEIVDGKIESIKVYEIPEPTEACDYKTGECFPYKEAIESYEQNAIAKAT